MGAIIMTRSGRADPPAGEALHLLELRAELQQQQIGTCLLECGEIFGIIRGTRWIPAPHSIARPLILLQAPLAARDRRHGLVYPVAPDEGMEECRREME